MKEVLTEGSSCTSGRLLGGWKDWVKKYMSERGVSRGFQCERQATWKMEG